MDLYKKYRRLYIKLTQELVILIQKEMDGTITHEEYRTMETLKLVINMLLDLTDYLKVSKSNSVIKIMYKQKSI